jgi:peptidoglycan/LPS O-acetylase OafA/YrhL
VKRNRIPELDFLRSLAVLLLLIHHSGVYQFKIGSFPLVSLSRFINHFLLGAFVFISGFLTAITLYRKEITDLPEYYRSRSIRLYIPYIVALLLFIFILGIQVSTQELIIHLLGLQILLSPKYVDPMRTLWFISLLVILLSITPILIVSSRKVKRLSVTYLIIFLSSIFIHNTFDIIDIRYFYFFPTFVIGSLIGFSKGLPAMKTSNELLVGSCFGLVIGIFMLSKNDLTYIPNLDLLHILWSTLFILSSIVLIFQSSQWLLHFRFVQNLILYMATGSFFVYLYHRPLWGILNDIFGSTGHKDEVVVNLLSIPVVFILAYILQNLYERVLVRR